MMQLGGIFNIMATPFVDSPDRPIDEVSLRRLTSFQIECGVYGLTILGVLGEAAKMSVEERRRVMDVVIEETTNRVPVVVGVSHPDTSTVIALSQAAMAAGAAGVMIAPPRMDEFSAAEKDERVFALYADVAAALGDDASIVVQDFPPVNNVIMSAKLLGRIAENIPAARYLKLEDPPLMEKISAIRAETDRFAIFGGLGGMFLLEELWRGAAGTMTGFAFSEILVAIYQAWSRGDQGRAAKIFDHYLPLIRYENQPIINLTIRKELLRRRGAMVSGVLRDPFVPIDAGTHDELTWVLERVGIDDPTQKITF
ncbi:dihydrodipicolinate synthase family protein [Anaerolineae bacterium CFX9]|nr:dihydrodipicolinate synthase family protein [Anaerolineae bacterium CFX9]